MPLELLENAEVVLEERPDVRDVVLQHRHAIDPQAEREPAPLLGVDLDVAQHLRMHHAAAEDFHPAGLGAGAAAGAFAEDARHVDFGRRLGEGEETRTHTDLRVVAEDAPDEVLDRRAQMSDVNPLVDQ